MNLVNYDQARLIIAEALERAAEAHEREDWRALKEGYDEIDRILPRDSDERFGKLYTALNFWDGWINSSNHHWLYYEPLTSEDWPTLARGIAQALRIDLGLSNPKVLEIFVSSPESDKGIVPSIRRLFKKWTTKNEEAG